MEQEPTTVQAPKTHRSLWAFIAVVLLAIVAGGIAHALRKQSFNDSASALFTPVVSPSPASVSSGNATTTTNQTNGTKTYTNAGLGYSVTFPDSLTANFTESTGTLSIDDPTKAKPNYVAMVSAAASSATLDKFVAGLKDGMVVRGDQKTTLAGTAAYEGIDQGLISQYGLYAVANGRSYILRFPTNDASGLAELKAGLTGAQKDIIDGFSLLK